MTELDPLHFVNVGPKGTFKESGKIKTRPADIDAIFAHFEQSGSKKLVIHFHGGLVPEAAGAATAIRMSKVYAAAGAHPVTFIWETGLLETISRNVTQIGDTQLFQTLLKYLLRQLAKRLGVDLGGKGAAGEVSDLDVREQLAKDEPFKDTESNVRAKAEKVTEPELQHLQTEMEYDLQFDMQADNALVGIVPASAQDRDVMKSELRDNLDTGGGKGFSIAALATLLAKVAIQVIRRFMKGRDHGLYTTVVEEILRALYLADFGAWTWGGMKTASSAMWYPNEGLINDDSYPGSYFIQKLSAYQATHPELVVDLVGHSAGSIAICNLFAALQRQKILLNVRNVVFLAPACLSRLMHSEIVNQPTRYEKFRVFTMTDANEQKDQLVPRLYNKSLLYFISGVLEDEADTPIAGMQRFWTGKAPFLDDYLLDSVIWLNDVAARRTVLSIISEGDEGYLSSALHHGDFDDDELTQASLRAIVSA
ncbi:hypothetical protein [Agrobacterium rosae]|uniref:hypothetical protein n=1 Tax=Agrobacterium rosae TaxID=1972867 RepID=UPI00203368B3|nr:hypothetical protein [Agrobacterium rosae]MCM2435828.1 hypothetical protein [Agrobacterium rosae]